MYLFSYWSWATTNHSARNTHHTEWTPHITEVSRLRFQILDHVDLANITWRKRDNEEDKEQEHEHK